MTDPTPPQTPPRIVDRAALSRHLARARKQGTSDHPLIERVTEDLADRLILILRDFERAAVISPWPGTLPQVLGTNPRIGTVINARLFDPLSNLVRHHGGANGAEFRVSIDDENLPFAPGGLDLLISAFALQAANDLPGALVQVCRALRPDGLFVGALFGGRTLFELRQTLLEAETECTGGVSPRVYPFADVRELGGLMQRAGFALPVADVDTVCLTYETPLHLMQELRAFGATNTLAGRVRNATGRRVLLRAAELYAEKFSNPDGRIRATVELVTLTGWAPDASQPKPLKPGSATTRLADALAADTNTRGAKTPPDPDAV